MWPSFYVVVDAVNDGGRIANTFMEYSVVTFSPYAPKYGNCDDIPFSNDVLAHVVRLFKYSLRQGVLLEQV